MQLQPQFPETIGPYRILRVVATGGMGVVYEAVHGDSGAQVALKTVRVAKQTDLAGIRREIHALSRLRHPGIVRILDQGVWKHGPWFTMEFLTGDPFGGWLQDLWGVERTLATGPVSTAVTAAGGTPLATVQRAPTLMSLAAHGRLVEVLGQFQRLCAPLTYIHSRGVVHRDLKPANVFIRTDGTPVLVDFGLMIQSRGGLGREVLEVGGALLGTVPYMAPEQGRRELVDARADLYALGCMLYEALTGRPPFLGGSAREVLEKHFTLPPSPPSQLVDGVPPALDDLVMRLLAKDPRQRIGHADDVAEALARLADPMWAVATTERAPGYLYRPDVVGRGQVIEELGRLREDAQGGAGAMALVVGESGVGKTFLVSEVAGRARAARMTVVTGQCFPVGADELGASDIHGAPLHPFGPLFRAIAEHCQAGGPGETRRLLAPAGALLAPHEPAIASLIEADPVTPLPELPGDAARRRLVSAVVDLLVAYAQDQPLCLVLDDLQWADDLSLDVLASLVPERLERQPILILATCRSEEMPERVREALGRAPVRQVLLPRLDEQALEAMVSSMLGLASAPEALVSFLARQSQGNPFFAAEYLRLAVGEGLLYRQNGAWKVAGTLAEQPAGYEALPLPGSLGELVGRRLANLTPAALRALNVAAVLGREFRGEVLGALAGFDEGQLWETTKELGARTVLEDLGDGRLRFVHDKVRETAYARIPPAERRELHGKAGLALEKHHESGQLALHAGVIGHHFDAAGLAAKAVHYLKLAGDQALGTSANGEAVAVLERALAWAEAPACDRLVRARIRCALGEGYNFLGERERSIAHHTAALRILGYRLRRRGPGALARILLELLRQLGHRVRRAGRANAGDEALLIAARAAEGVAHALAKTDELLGIVEASLMAVNLGDRSGTSPRLPLGILGFLAGSVGLRNTAARYFRRMHAPTAGSGDERSLNGGVIPQAAFLMGQGEMAAAEAVLRENIERGQQLHYRPAVAYSHGLVALIALLGGDLTEAQRRARCAQENLEPGEARFGLLFASVEAVVLCLMGRTAEAQGCIEMAERWSDQSDALLRLNWMGAQALVQARLGRLEAAEATARTVGERLARDLPRVATVGVLAVMGVMETWLALWRRGQDAGGPGEAPRQARRALRQVRAWARRYPSGESLALLYEGQVAWLAGREARARELWQRSHRVAARGQLRLVEGMAQALLG